MDSSSLPKSSSADSFLKLQEYKTIEFEGDGTLGIYLNKNDKNLMEVSKIKNGTVANEYYELKLGMTINKVNEYYFKDYSYEKFLKLIGTLWIKNNKITIEFCLPDMNDNEIYKFLQSINCEKYYDIFEKLGAYNKSDLIFVEDDDLIEINFDDRKKIMNTIKRTYSDIFDFDDI